MGAIGRLLEGIDAIAAHQIGPYEKPYKRLFVIALDKSMNWQPSSTFKTSFLSCLNQCLLQTTDKENPGVQVITQEAHLERQCSLGQLCHSGVGFPGQS